MAKISQVIRPIVDIRKPRNAIGLLLIVLASAILWWNTSYIVSDMRIMAIDYFGDTIMVTITLIIIAVSLYTLAAIMLKRK